MVEKWNLMKPQGNEWNLLYLQNTKIALQAKVSLRWPITIWFTNLFLCTKRRKFRMQKLQDKEWKKLETIPAWQLEQVKNKMEVILEAQRDKKKVHFATLMEICHLKKAELEPTLQRQSRAPCWLCKRRLWSLRSFYWTGLVRVPNDCRKSDGCYCKITRFWRTTSWCSICLHQLKLEDAPRLLKILKSESECPDVWMRLPQHKWPKPWAQAFCCRVCGALDCLVFVVFVFCPIFVFVDPEPFWLLKADPMFRNQSRRRKPSKACHSSVGNQRRARFMRSRRNAALAEMQTQVRDIPTAVDSVEAETVKWRAISWRDRQLRRVQTEAWRDAQKWSITVRTPSLKVKLLVVRRTILWSKRIGDSWHGLNLTADDDIVCDCAKPGQTHARWICSWKNQEDFATESLRRQDDHNKMEKDDDRQDGRRLQERTTGQTTGPKWDNERAQGWGDCKTDGAERSWSTDAEAQCAARQALEWGWEAPAFLLGPQLLPPCLVFLHLKKIEFKGWVTDYKKCSYQGLTATEVSNFIRDLQKMVPDQFHKYIEWDQTRKE